MSKIGLIYNKKLAYSEFPFNPDKIYPELNYDYKPQPSNLIYNELREMFERMGYDKENYNKKSWNPLGFLINKGNRVLLKPNFVMDYEKDPFCVITHASIIRFLIDYVYIATGDAGEIIVGDAPQMNANWNMIKKYTHINELIELLNKKNIPVKLLDFRAESVEVNKGIWSKRKIIQNNGINSTIINLKEESLLYNLEKNKRFNFYGADYNRKIVNYNHNIQRNLYCITNAFFNSDVIISVPKLKTHKKAGVTLNQKNLIGINVNKNYLPHYRIGCPNQNGDAFPNMNSFLNFLRFLRYFFRDLFLTKYYSRFARFFHKLFDLRKFFEVSIIKLFFPKFYSHYFHMIDGGWSGNDTLWRTILDLNIILRYSDKNGKISEKNQKRLFSVIDGIIAGDKDGPLDPKPKHVGIILMGENLFLTDIVATKLMGFEYKRIPSLEHVFSMKKYSLIERNEIDELKIISNNNNLNNIGYHDLNLNLNFDPPRGWSILQDNNF